MDKVIKEIVKANKTYRKIIHHNLISDGISTRCMACLMRFMDEITTHRYHIGTGYVDICEECVSKITYKYRFK